MEKRGVIPIVQELCYDYPKWLGKVEYKDYIELTKDTSKHDVDLFLISLLGYNNININREPNVVFKELISEEGIVAAGGILFFGECNKVLPSCCCGLESWREILEGVVSGTSPWMGHDPYPIFEYSENRVRLWSDDYLGYYETNLSKEDMYYIEYGRQNLIIKIKDIEVQLMEFAKFPLYNRLKEIIEIEMANSVVEKFVEWFKVCDN
ncbi:hypothetical protein [Metabacillus halosaccharovorans]|uniref:hypothetical protein n=1 Tax=Metabacillus halosaccharovorans TaxID=930124 RepID=UPI001C1FFFA9|nr:hypothetical protein [Metabacillus halosaccharovorans]MBU7592843.1 hypothetical protein [Metabacillus halosaccharovorans]